MIYDMLDFLKSFGAVRKFKKTNIPEKIINKILESGNWGFSILGVQPWNFVCIKNRKILNKLANVLVDNSYKIPRTLQIIVGITATTLKNSAVVIAIYNNKKVSQRLKKYGKSYSERGHMAELQCIGGSIQNMCLESNLLGLGCVWIDSPNFFEREINTILDEEGELIAFLVLGYPNESPHRSKRSMNIATFKRLY